MQVCGQVAQSRCSLFIPCRKPVSSQLQPLVIGLCHAGYAQGPDPLSLIPLDKLRSQLEVNVVAQLRVTQVIHAEKFRSSYARTSICPVPLSRVALNQQAAAELYMCSCTPAATCSHLLKHLPKHCTGSQPK